MPLFAIIGYDVADSTEKRLQARPAHIERLTALDAQNRLVIAGPTPIKHAEPAMSGSLIIAHFDSLEAAQAWAETDPYITAGVYSHVDIKPFVQALPKID
ncbi:YciI family protein [Moraxella nasicaprae]|uniref:YciI family protein n=1 Tax=Moraxella nasicaprae TaxID=2904122 RepID=A0ABY6F3D4_9GAMM|nr:YciI family protein [Moraxella nasicaprae]UXZ04611.1 YciI family protein [Moraxella nasicaprae]